MSDSLSFLHIIYIINFAFQNKQLMRSNQSQYHSKSWGSLGDNMLVFTWRWYVNFFTSWSDMTLLDPTKYTLPPTTQYIMVKQARTLQSIHLERERYEPWQVVIYRNSEIPGKTFWRIPTWQWGIFFDCSLILLCGMNPLVYCSLALFTSFIDFSLCYHSWPHLKSNWENLHSEFHS